MIAARTFHRVQVGVASLERAKAFYARTFGWSFVPERTGVAVMAGTGRPGAADWAERSPEVALVLGRARAPHGGVGLAVGVDDIPAAVRRAVAAGGSERSGEEVIDDIRTAVVADSEGNELGLWSPGPGNDFWWRPHAGARIVDGATFQYLELEALDLDRASDFYAGVFGWAFAPPHPSHRATGPVPSAGRALYGADVVRYCTTARPELGLRRVGRRGERGSTGLGVGVEDLDAAAEAVTRAGGAVLGEPEDVGGPTRLAVGDTEGNRFTLMAQAPGEPAAWRPHAVGDRVAR